MQIGSIPPDTPAPPASAEWLLALLLTEENDREAVLGDLAEEFNNLGGRENAAAWYWSQVLLSAPALFRLSLSKSLTRRNLMNQLSRNRPDNRRAVIGFVLLLPALLLVTGGILFSLGFTGLSDFYDRVGLFESLFHPAIIAGGGLLAVGLNFFQVFSFDLKRENGDLISTIVIRGRLLNLALIAACALVGLVILVYGFVENFFPII